ncbi:MAG: hypothetical protein AB1Z23_13200 [Eubacteriales bacterium]
MRFAQNFLTRLLFAIIVIITLVYTPHERREKQDKGEEKYYKSNAKLDDLMPVIFFVIFGLVILALFIPQKTSYWIFFVISILALLYTLASNLLYNENIIKKNQEKIKNNKSAFKRHIRYLAKKRRVLHLMEFVCDKSQSRKEFAISQLDKVLNEHNSEILLDALDQENLNIL